MQGSDSGSALVDGDSDAADAGASPVGEASDERSRSPEPTEKAVLVVGPSGVGGIAQYIDDQVARLPDDYRTRTHTTVPERRSTGALLYVETLLWTLLSALRFTFRRRPDVVHVHTSYRFAFYRGSFYVLFGTYVWRRPVFVHVHGSSFDEFVADASPLVGRLQSVVFDAATEVIVLSTYWKGVVSRRADPTKIRVVPNAVEPVEYDPEYPSTPRVVFVSNLIERKGVRELVAALGAVLADDRGSLRVDIAGDGPLSDVVESLAEEHQRVTYHGYVSEERKRALLERGSIYVLPSYAEGLPIALLEGMAGGNAAVATTVGSIPEVIDDRSGRLVEPGDDEALAAALESLVASPTTVQEMARRNRSLIEARYSWERVVTQLVEAYESA